MIIIGTDFIKPLLDQQYFSAKMVFNAHGVIIFSVHQEHRNQTAENISYEDNYKGNALAAMLAPGKLEIRYHKAFADKQVAVIIAQFKQHPDLSFMADWTATYQGRLLDI
ncbi:MAG: hypothetical protein JKX70_00630 [Phycisphaerales bacterium]|nr:hypothetical protein [Phycisphaerales bacterium]